MKILHTDTDDISNPLRGGQPVRTFEINSRISQQHDVTVFTASYPNSAKHVQRGNINYQRLGVTIPRFGLSSHLSFLACLPSAIKKTPHDLVVEEFTPPFGFCGLPYFTNQPVVSMVQWFFFDDWQKRYKLPFEKIMRNIAKKNRYQHFIVQTNKMGDYFKDLMPQAQLYKIPCGISANAFNLNTTLGDYVLYLGRLDIQHKGLDFLLETWSRIHNSGINLPLVIVGAGSGEAYLTQKIAQLGLLGCINLKGRVEVEGAEKQILLNGCRFLVMPSRQETFGITALEAMAASKPVVAFDIDHLNELLRPEWARLCPLGDTEKFAQEIVTLWQSPQLISHLGEQGFKKANDYQWDVIAQNQLNIYQEIIATSHSKKGKK